MSKTNSLAQSMAALFTPESERARKSQADSGSSVPRGGRSHALAGAQKLGESPATGDSLGNPNGPGGYMPLGKPRKEEEHPEASAPAQEEAPAHVPTYRPAGGESVIRLAPGYDRLLLDQHKICEKATDLATEQEAPQKYRAQRRGKLLSGKSRGCILDLVPEVENASKDKRLSSDDDNDDGQSDAA